MRAGPRPKLVGDAEHLEPKLVLAAAKAAGHPGQNDCDVCGLVGAGCFGFGSFIGRRGIWACNDLECRTEAKARAESHRQPVAAE